MKSALFHSRGSFARRSPRLLRRGWGAAFSAIALAFFLPVASAQTDAAEELPPGGEVPVVAVVRMPAPKELSEKVLAIARQIQPGPQTEALPFILGGMLGDPMLESISATENVGVVLVAHEGDLTPILVLKLSEESPLRDSLSNFSLVLDDFEEWTFARPEGVSAASIEGHEKALISAVRAGRRHDVELAAHGRVLSRQLREALEDMPDGLTGHPLLGPLAEALLSESDSVRELGIGLDLSGAVIDQVFSLRAEEGSALADFLDQERPADLEFARYLPADGAIAFLGGFDAQATLSYFDRVMGQLRRSADGEARAVWETLSEIGTRYLRSTNGASGGVLSLDGMQLQMVSVATTRLSDEELVELLSRSVGVVEELLSPRIGDADAEPAQKLLAHEFTVDGIRVHVLRTEAPAAPGLPSQRQDMHYAIVEGYLVNTSDLGRLAGLVQAIREGKPVDNNLASRITLADDALFEFQIDLVRYFGGIMGAFMPEEMAVNLRGLQERNLSPVRGTLSARGGEAEMKISLPVDAIAAAYQTMAAFMAEQQRQLQRAPAPSLP